MLVASQLVGFGAASPAAWVETAATATDETDLTTYTFSSQSLGSPAADRYIIVGVTARRATAFTITSVTVAGVTATLVAGADASNVSSGNTRAALYIAAVPASAGLTGDVVVVVSGAALRLGVICWRATGLLSATASSTVASTANDPTGTLTIPADGFGLGIVTSGVAAPNVAWTGLTEDADTDLGTAATMSGASLRSLGGFSGTVTADFTTPSVSAGAFAAWR